MTLAPMLDACETKGRSGEEEYDGKLEESFRRARASGAARRFQYQVSPVLQVSCSYCPLWTCVSWRSTKEGGARMSHAKCAILHSPATAIVEWGSGMGRMVLLQCPRATCRYVWQLRIVKWACISEDPWLMLVMMKEAGQAWDAFKIRDFACRVQGHPGQMPGWKEGCRGEFGCVGYCCDFAMKGQAGDEKVLGGHWERRTGGQCKGGCD
jgi:hypothetical protein